jgi:hypothetical protein
MENALNHMGVIDPVALMKTPEVRTFVEQAEKQLMAIPLDTPENRNPANQAAILHDWILRNPENIETLRPVMPKHLESEAAQVAFMNYIFGIEETRKYGDLTARLGMYDPTNPYANFPERLWVDARRPRATAIFILDGNPSAAERFRNASYEAWGGRYNLPNDGKNRPLSSH